MNILLGNQMIDSQKFSKMTNEKQFVVNHTLKEIN